MYCKKSVSVSCVAPHYHNGGSVGARTAMGQSLPACSLQCLWSNVILGQTQVLCSSPVGCHKMAPTCCVGLLGLPLRLAAFSLQSLSRGHQRSITLNPRRKGECSSVCSWRSWSLGLRMHPPFILFFFLNTTI